MYFSEFEFSVIAYENHIFCLQFLDTCQKLLKYLMSTSNISPQTHLALFYSALTLHATFVFRMKYKVSPYQKTNAY